MSAETFLSKKLRRFEVVDYSLVMLVYCIFGLLIVSVYHPLQSIAWWFYLTSLVISVFPLITHLISQPGATLTAQFRSCVKSNTASLQALLFLTMFFTAGIVISIFPFLADIKWWAYLVLMVVLALKPLQKNWFW